MNWQRIGSQSWHGVSAAVLAGATAIAVLQTWPNKLQWLILAAGMAGAFVKGVNGYNSDPGDRA